MNRIIHKIVQIISIKYKADIKKKKSKLFFFILAIGQGITGQFFVHLSNAHIFSGKCFIKNNSEYCSMKRICDHCFTMIYTINKFFNILIFNLY